MGFNDFLKKLFGNKSLRDMKEIQPYVDKINAIYPEIAALSDDELRARTQAIMQKLQDTVAPQRARIKEIKDSIEAMAIDEREKSWSEVDKLEKEITAKLEEVLTESIHEVFAIVKNTGYRFSQVEEIVVTATDFDRELAVTKDFVTIDGDKAIFKTDRKSVV